MRSGKASSSRCGSSREGVPVVRPEDLIDSVIDEVSFVQFLQALAVDFAEDLREAQPSHSAYAAGPRGWEHGKVDAYLEAAAAWAQARPAKPSANTWRRCAEILLAGKYYD